MGSLTTTQKTTIGREKKTSQKNKDKNDAEISKTMIYASFDLQAVLTLPYAGDAQIYFSIKLSIMNFTVYDSRKKGICYLWDETHGKKGSVEIKTCLLKYLKSLPGEIEHVVFYACGGQNRNQNVFADLLYAVNTVGNIKKVDLKFMESGHSYLEADSIHATIERYRRHRNLYVPSDYKCLIESGDTRPVIYLDVTWMNQNHSRNHIWQNDMDSEGFKVPTGKGDRLIVCHAGAAKFGFISSSKLIFNSKNNGDYHSQMNSEIFHDWFYNMLLLLEEPCVIIIDNIPHHSVLMDNVPKSNAKKCEVQKWLYEKGIDFSPLETLAELREKVKMAAPREKRY
ncbi:hypothetical protein AGLY_012448 [Aphis glycines]|uniref:Tc1-like transposase DDE domain-containing protein n=1 Tax=Aphis glycines TaxID=307491 RepID=A0A6G0TA46_APHGL|nr:hypothetical protein AGLY_012448 [Aphis glycines]